MGVSGIGFGDLLPFPFFDLSFCDIFASSLARSLREVIMSPDAAVDVRDKGRGSSAGLAPGPLSTILGVSVSCCLGTDLVVF